MLMKEIAVRALRFAGRDDIATALENSAELQREQEEALHTLLYCANATEDELARYWYPIQYTELIYSAMKQFRFAALTKVPLKILDVKDEDGNEIEYVQFSDHIEADTIALRLTYACAPKLTRSIDVESEYGDMLGSEIIALGAAAEYCLVNGEMELSEALESRFYAALERVHGAPKKGGSYIPPRRWV